MLTVPLLRVQTGLLRHEHLRAAQRDTVWDDMVGISHCE